MFKKNFSNEFERGALTLFITMNIFNVLNFVFHFLMGRLLTPVEYGTLAALMSLVYIYSIPTEAIQNVISRYVVNFASENRRGKIKNLFKKASKRAFKFSLLLFILVAPISIFISNFLQIDFWLIFVINFLVFNAFLGPITRGIMQGTKKFDKWGINILIEGVFKIIIPFVLILAGFKLFGAVIGVVLASIFGLATSYLFIRDILKEKEEETSFRGIYKLSASYFSVMFLILFIFSIDIILAKRFFSAEMAGQYSVISIIGKIIFLGTSSISKVMFPLASEKFDRHQGSFGTLINSLILTGILSIMGILVYFLLPELIVEILYGTEYLAISHLIYLSGIGFAFLALTNLILIYGLSTKKLERKYPFLYFFIIINLVILFSYHKNIEQYILGFVFSNIIIFIGSLFFLKRWRP